MVQGQGVKFTLLTGTIWWGKPHGVGQRTPNPIAVGRVVAPPRIHRRLWPAQGSVRKLAWTLSRGPSFGLTLRLRPRDLKDRGKAQRDWQSRWDAWSGSRKKLFAM